MKLIMKYIGVVIALWVISFIPLAFWTDRSLDWWLTYLKNNPTDCPFWLSFLISILAPIDFLFNILTEIVRLALD